MSRNRQRRRPAARLAVALVATSLPLTAGFAQAAPDQSTAPGPQETAPQSSPDHRRGPKKPHPRKAHPKQPSLDARAKDTIRKGRLVFKDLNDNGRVDVYEDWRKPVERRAADLVDRMTLDEKAGLMLIDTLNAACGGKPSADASNYLDQQQMRRFVFRNTVVADSSDCTPGNGLSGSVVTPAEAATHMNTIQAKAEGSRLGIPVLYKSNARNHIDPLAVPGVNTSGGVMTAFPKEAGIAAAALGRQAQQEGKATDGDMSVVEDFANVMGQEWHAIGLRGMYGYMADMSTEPRWYRIHETFSESAELNANIMGTLVEELQGKVDDKGVSLTPDSDVALTVKHFPGGGPQELGLDPHYSFGKTQVYPGDNFEGHLLPFQAAIDAGVSSIMPYYGVPIDVTHNGVKYDQTGMAFSKQVVTDLLRGELGFKGYVNSDTGIINDRAWGLEDKSVPERVAAAINGGTDTLSGFHDVKTITDLVDDGLLSQARVDESAKRLLTPLFQMGLFENPYVDQERANDLVGSESSSQVALDIQRSSQVLLQNKTSETGATLPMKAGATVYVLGNIDADSVAQYGYRVIDGNATPRPSAKGADYVLVNMSAKNDAAATKAYSSKNLDSNPTNPIVMPGSKGLDGKSPYGASDACNTQPGEKCTDDTLMFGGSLPWESGVLDFTGMQDSKSWDVVPSLDVVQQAMAEVGDPNKVVLNIYFRQPYVLDDASGLTKAGAIVANFGASDTAMLDVLSARVAPQGRLPFALPKTTRAVAEQHPDAPGYDETADGALFEYGHGLTYDAQR